MNKKNFFSQEYVAPELEVISTVVECGFSLSSSIEDVTEEDYGDF